MRDPKLIYDSFRKKWVKSSPEEEVRQRLLHVLVEKLSFPRDLISVEHSLNQMPHFQEQKATLPNRRFDVVCFAKNIHKEFSLYPLLLIECKAKDIKESSLRQVMGYNYHIQAPYIALVTQDEVCFLSYDFHSKEHTYYDFIPSYKDLLNQLK